MADTINLQPQILHLALYSGDGFGMKLKCVNKDGEPIDIGGQVKAQIRLDRLTPEDPAEVSFSVVMTDSYLGIILLSLTGDQTRSLIENPATKNGRFTGVWDCEWTAENEEPRTICQGNVECVADVTQ